MNSKDIILELQNIEKYYNTAGSKFYALKNINLKVRKGEMLSILGQSGSGKSTLMNIMSGIDSASNGKIFFKEKDLSGYNDLELEKYRRDEIGFVLQTYNLVPNLKVWENIELGLRLNKNKDKKIIDDLLDELELKEYKNSFPNQLSGGGKQRVAIARALAKNPNILVCDEPTGALDEKNSIKVMSKLQEYNRKNGTTIIVITHNPAYAKTGNRAIYISDGAIKKEVVNDSIVDANNLGFSDFYGG
jgi:ABC-type antimicrobial peptide transport system, ATPase component